MKALNSGDIPMSPRRRCCLYSSRGRCVMRGSHICPCYVWSSQTQGLYVPISSNDCVSRVLPEHTGRIPFRVLCNTGCQTVSLVADTQHISIWDLCVSGKLYTMKRFAYQMQAFACANQESRVLCKVVCQQGCSVPLLDAPAKGGVIIFR